jgi:hypothetical protein
LASLFVPLKKRIGAAREIDDLLRTSAEPGFALLDPPF